MPEILTKHPQVLLKILKEAGVKCGVGEKQEILTSCPPNNFCRLPTGELCIYGLDNMSHMTQITYKDLSMRPAQFSVHGATLISLMIVIFALGIVAGIYISKKKSD